MDIWELTKKRIAVELSADSFRNWFENTWLHSAAGDVFRVSVPNEAAKEYLEQVYSDLVQKVLRDLEVPTATVVYEVRGRTADNDSAAGHNPYSPEAEVTFREPVAQLNPKYTFESFVVGSCNQFAHAAAKAVASRPSEMYNPLFIYGGVGMGKTHLMHAIGRALLANYGKMRLVYTSSERFMNEMVSSIKLQRMPLFHQHYRSADVLLVDDIQILGKREGTQEEFFHTFNALHESRKQIVISSDSPPKEIPGLVERLRSRFEWGLMVDIQAPDLETKMAILDKKADDENIRLPEDVRIYIATKTKSNVRELEGALIKLIAYSSVTGTEINLAMAQQVLKHMVPNPHEKRVTIDAIIKATAAKYGLQATQLKQKSNARSIAEPRQIAMYLTKELTQASLPEIGRAFGGKHHTTVLHSIRKIEKLRNKEPDLNRILHSLIDTLH